ncbi:MAG: AsmA-like C-terminal region-containing protein [Hyphomicrobiales bacterium]|nr:AsmA-like C-terminal region-containing protein [Hyphomicrobiales bacterium]
MTDNPRPIHPSRSLTAQKPTLPARLAAPVAVRLSRLKNAIPPSVQQGVATATRRSAKVTGVCFGALSVLTVLIAAVGYARLYQGPISMDFLLPTIEAAVNGQIPKSRLNIAGAVLRLGENRRSIEFRLRDVSIVDDNGAQVAQAPFASIGISAQALLAGKIAAGQINLIEPRLVAAYSPDEGLALSFSRERESASSKSDKGAPAEAASAVSTEPPREIAQSDGRINLVEVLGGLFERTREQGSATSYLTEFGIKNAAVYYDHGDRIAKWLVPDAVIELSHLKKRSVISGAISVQPEKAAGPWRIDFRAEQILKNSSIALSASVTEIVPSALAGEFSDYQMLRKLNLPIAVAASAEMAKNGDIETAKLSINLGKGEFNAPWDKKHPAQIDGGQFRLAYSLADGRIDLEPSYVAWGESRLELAGSAIREDGAGERGLWRFDVGSPNFVLASEEFQLPRARMDALSISGAYDPAIQSARLDEFLVKAGASFIRLSGTLGASPQSGGLNVTGEFSPMSLPLVKLLWPKFVAHGAREWVGKSMTTGRLDGATLRVSLSPNVIADLKNDGDVPSDAVLFKIDLSGLTMAHIKGLPPIKAPRAVATVQGRRFVFETTEEAAIEVPSGGKVLLNSGQFIVGDLRPRVPYGEIHFKASGPVAAVEELLDHEPLGYVRKGGFERNRVIGKTSGSFSIGMPMKKDLGFKDLTIRGKARAEDLRAKIGESGVGVHGGSIAFDLSEKAIDAQGDLRVNGVPAQLSWQRIFDAPPEHQPRIRLRIVLTDKARMDLGAGLNHVIKGDVPTELSIAMRKDAPAAVSVEADFTNAEISVAGVGWRKPRGQRAMLSLNVDKDGERIRLTGVRLLGDDLNVSGSVLLNEQKKPVMFEFPTLVLNPLTKLELKGALTPQNNWKIDLRGASFDGRQFFRSLFSPGQLSEGQAAPAKGETGADVHAEIGVIHGFFDTTVRNVVIDARKRGGRLTALDVFGRLNGSSPIAVRLEGKSGQPRTLLAEATDAGAAFRVIGFYPAVRGGEASLRVNLDGGDGAAEKEGRLYAQNFVVVGDQVIDQVMTTQAPRGAGAAPVRRRPQPRRPAAQTAGAQQQIEFNRMTVAFAVGHGQFVLQDSAINGPLLGATIRGRIDFARDTINLSGVYVPLYGINAALNGIPLIGDLLTGPRGEGIFGITFAVQGAQSKPDVVVNPVSLITPGFLRGIMEFDHTPPRIIAREPAPVGPAETRATSQPPVRRQ